jgi:hypothetical protein
LSVDIHRDSHSFAGALKGLRLIPRTPLPSPSPEPAAVDEADDANSNSVDEMTRGELEEEVLRWRNSRKDTNAEKVEKVDKKVEKNVEKKVEKRAERKVEKKVAAKRERSESGSAGPSTLVPKKRKKSKVIDLTGDSD